MVATLDGAAPSSEPVLTVVVVVDVLVVEIALDDAVDDGVMVVEMFSMARSGSDSPFCDGVDGVDGPIAVFADSVGEWINVSMVII